MKFGKVIEQSFWSFPKEELSDPPIYSLDRRYISSKDGMMWFAVAPHAAACAPPNEIFGFTSTAVCTSSAAFSGAAPGPGPHNMWTFNGSSNK